MTEPTTHFDAEREAALAQTFVRLADTLVSDYDVQGLLADLGESCISLLDVDAAGILLLHDGRLELASASSLATHDIEIFQMQTDEGPCLDAVRSGRPVWTSDLGVHNRWPRFADAALRRGLHAVHAIPLSLRGEVIGGLNLFRRSAYAWSHSDMVTAKALADVATIGILHERNTTSSVQVQRQLQEALVSRVVIEQAKGALAAHSGLAPEETFQLLRRFCRHHKLALRVAAAQVLEGGLTVDDLRRVRAASDGDAGQSGAGGRR